MIWKSLPQSLAMRRGNLDRKLSGMGNGFIKDEKEINGLVKADSESLSYVMRGMGGGVIK